MALHFYKKKKLINVKGSVLFVSLVVAGFVGKIIINNTAPEGSFLVACRDTQSESKEAAQIKADITHEVERIVQLERENRELKDKVSRGVDEKTYSMKPYIWRICKEFGDKYGLPKEVWYPIIMMESGGNPTTTTVTKKEDSRGLLQINTRVHDIDKIKVYNPEINLSYQMPVLAETYREAKRQGMSGFDVVCYVEKYGQRCQWTETVRKVLKKYYDEVMGNG